jgi:hypothetical protein
MRSGLNCFDIILPEVASVDGAISIQPSATDPKLETCREHTFDAHGCAAALHSHVLASRKHASCHEAHRVESKIGPRRSVAPITNNTFQIVHIVFTGLDVTMRIRPPAPHETTGAMGEDLIHRHARPATLEANAIADCKSQSGTRHGK